MMDVWSLVVSGFVAFASAGLSPSHDRHLMGTTGFRKTRTAGCGDYEPFCNVCYGMERDWGGFFLSTTILENGSRMVSLGFEDGAGEDPGSTFSPQGTVFLLGSATLLFWTSFFLIYLRFDGFGGANDFFLCFWAASLMGFRNG